MLVQLASGALRTQARAGMLPTLLRGLVRMPQRRAENAGGSLAERLAGVPQSDWQEVTLDLVRAQVAPVLGHSSSAAMDAGREFTAIGLNSLGAVELRNRLAQATGVRLPSTLVFDHPTPASVTRFLLTSQAGSRRRGDDGGHQPGVGPEQHPVLALA